MYLKEFDSHCTCLDYPTRSDPGGDERYYAYVHAVYHVFLEWQLGGRDCEDWYRLIGDATQELQIASEESELIFAYGEYKTRAIIDAAKELGTRPAIKAAHQLEICLQLIAAARQRFKPMIV